MGDVKVTREHRALVQAKRFPTSMTPTERAWIDGDDDAGFACGTLSFPRAAELVAEAEALGAARERERIEALIDWEIEASNEGAPPIGELETLKYLREAVTSGKSVPVRTDQATPST